MMNAHAIRLTTTSSDAIIGVLIRAADHPALTGLRYIKEQLEQICQQYQCQLSDAANHFIQALELDRKGQLVAAVHTYQQAMSACNELESRLALQAQLMVASIAGEREEFIAAQQGFMHVLKSVEQLDPATKTVLYNNLAAINLSMHCYTEAQHYSLLAQQAALVSQSHNIHIMATLNLSEALFKLNQPQQSLTQCQHAMTLAQQYQEPHILGICYCQFANLLHQHQPQAASQIEHAYCQALTLIEKVEGNYNYLDTQLKYAQFLSEQARQTDANAIIDVISEAIWAHGLSDLKLRLLALSAKQFSQAEQHPQLIANQQQQIDLLTQLTQSMQMREGQMAMCQVRQLEQQQQYRITQTMQTHLQTISDIGQLIATADELAPLMPQVLEQIRRIFPATEFGIALYNAPKKLLSYDYFIDDSGLLPAIQVDCHEVVNFGSYAVITGSTVHLNTVTEESIRANTNLADYPSVSKEQSFTHDLELAETQSVLICPIFLANEPLGIISLQHHLPNIYQQHHRQLFEKLAVFIAIAIKNWSQRATLKSDYQHLQIVAKTDALTQLYNRQHLKVLVPAIEQQFRQLPTSEDPNKTSSISVVLIDLDDYKGYNDSLGHAAGDRALAVVAELIKRVFSGSQEHCFRYGGDELLVISLGLTETALKQKLQTLLAEMAQQALTHPTTADPSGCLTLSVGACIRAVDGHSYKPFNEAFAIADQQLYLMKEKGRNGYQLHTIASSYCPA